MAVKRYNGTSWDVVAGKGDQGTSSSITTWVKTASGGETSLSGNSDSSTTLAYTPGQEQLFINGVLQVRGSDYTATNGTSITGLTALVAGDIATVTSVNAFSVTGAVPLSTVTANGDLIVGTSSGAVGRLGIGSTGNVLTVSGGVPAWSAPAGGGALTFITSATAAGSASTLSINNCFSSTYDNYLILSDLKAATGNENFYFKLRASGTDASTNYYYSGFWISTVVSSTLQPIVSAGADVNFRLRDIGAEKALHTLEISNPFNAIDTTILTKGIQSLTGGAVESAFILGSHSTDTSYDGFSLIASTNLTGTVRVYGYSNS